MHIKAIEAHLKQGGSLPVQHQVLHRGRGGGRQRPPRRLHPRPQAGSRRRRRRDLRLADVRPRHSVDLLRPARAAYFQIDLRGTKSDLHSGSFGGAVANPAFVLAQVLAQMKDRGGRIKIPGFYDDVRPLSDEERAEWKKLPFNETKYRKELGAPKLFGEKGYTTLERVWARPTFEVNGLLSGFTGEGAKTVLPAVGDGQGQHAARARSGSAEDRRSVRGATCEKICAEDRRAEDHAHARRQAVDDRVRQQVRARRRPRDRAGLRQGAGLQPRGRLDSGGLDVPGGARRCRACCSASACPTRTRTRPNEKLDLGNFHNGIIASAYLYEEIANALSWQRLASRLAHAPRVTEPESLGSRSLSLSVTSTGLTCQFSAATRRRSVLTCSQICSCSSRASSSTSLMLASFR